MGFFSSIFKGQADEGAATKSKRASRQQASDHAESVQRLRVQARRRLLGAAVLVGIGIIAFPILFESQPRPVPMDLPIVIPSRDAQPAGKPALSQADIPAQLPEQAVAQGPQEMESEASAPSADPMPLPDSAPAAPSAAASSEKAAASATRLVVQVGAFADKKSAQEARQRLERKGLKTYAQVVQTKEGERIRVRLGPFTQRTDADKAVAAAKSVGLDGKVLTL